MKIELDRLFSSAMGIKYLNNKACFHALFNQITNCRPNNSLNHYRFFFTISKNKETNKKGNPVTDSLTLLLGYISAKERGLTKSISTNVMRNNNITKYNENRIAQ